MRRLGTSFAVSVLFFGVSALTAVETRSWLVAAFWAVVGFAFLWLDLKGASRTHE